MVLQLTFYFIFLKILFIYSLEAQREREAETQAEGEAGPCREPDAGLDPRTPGSRPEPQADAQPLSHPVVRVVVFLRIHLFRNLC